MTAATTITAADPVRFYDLDEHDHPEGGSTMLGFWIYLMSDCLIFAILFACYAVLGGNYAAGPGPKDLFDLPLVALNTADGSKSINPQVGKANGTEFVNVLSPSEKVTVSGGRLSFSLSGKETKVFVAGLAAPEMWVRGTHASPADGVATASERFGATIRE